MCLVSNVGSYAEEPIFSITRDGSGNVISLDYFGPAEGLKRLKIDGKEIHELQTLRSVFLNHHEISDEEIDYLVSLRSVVDIRIGDIPEEVVMTEEQLSRIGQMTWIESLTLSRRPESHEAWSFINKLTDLKSLRIIYDFYDQASLYLVDLSQLEELYINGDLSHIAAENITKLQNLKDLTVISSDIDDQFVCTISSLPRLTRFDIKSYSYSKKKLTPKVFDAIAGMKGLQSLEMNIQASAEDLMPLSELASMEKLVLYNCERISFSLTGKMPKLRSLNLGGNQNSETLKYIVGHENIRVLDLYQTLCSEQLVDVLSSLPNLERVVLKGWEDSEALDYAKMQLENFSILQRYNGQFLIVKHGHDF